MAGKLKRKINASKFLEDFRSGKNYDVLMKEYELTRSGLDKLLAKLVDRGHLDPTELVQQTSGRIEDQPDLSADSDASATYSDHLSPA